MKKFFTTGNIALFIFAILCYLALVFLPDFIQDVRLQTQLTVMLVTNFFMSLIILNFNHSEITNHNEQHLNRESLLSLVEALKEMNALQADLSTKIGILAVDTFNTKCAVERIEKQTKPKTPTPRKKKEA